MQSAYAVGLHDQDRPFFGKPHASHQRTDVGIVISTTIDDQAAVLKSVETDTRPTTAPGETRELGWRPIIESCEFQDGASDSQRELGADPQPEVLVGCVPNADSSGGQADSGLGRPFAKLGDDPLDACGEAPLGNPVRGGLGDQVDSRGIDHETDAAKLPRDFRPPSQETEVQAARRPDVEAMAHHEGGGLGSGRSP